MMIIIFILYIDRKILLLIIHGDEYRNLDAFHLMTQVDMSVVLSLSLSEPQEG